MSDVEETVLRDLLTASKDGDWGFEEPPGTLTNIIRGTDFADVRLGRVARVPMRYLPDESLDRRTLQENDILIETAGGSKDRPTGRTLLVTGAALAGFSGPVTCASFARYLRIDPALADPRYVYWYLQYLHASGAMWKHQVQHTGVARFQFTKFAATERIPLPDSRTQGKLADILGALDDKVTVNHHIAAVADVLRSDLLADAQMQQPDDFVAQPLSQLAEFVNGRAFTKGATGKGRMVIRIAEINSGPGPSTVYHEIEVADKHLARPGDVLFSWSGSLAVARWFRPESIINQHIFKVIPRDDVPHWLAFEAVKSKITHYRAVAADKATTMGHIQRRHLDEEVTIPDNAAVGRLDRRLGGLWRRALVAEQESLALAALRDNLLPELMSGRLRIKEAEKVVEEAI
jgi:type I restriction enzyme S subunit